MEAIGRLAGGVAHDFNNILGIINACAEFLRDRIDSAAEPSQYVENIKKASERGASLTRQLLTFSRSSSVQPRILDLNDRLKDVGKLLRPLMGDDVEILIVSKSPAAVVEADPGQLDQIVVNLAVNARDAMPRGGKFILETRAERFDETSSTSTRTCRGKLCSACRQRYRHRHGRSHRVAHLRAFLHHQGTGQGNRLGLATVYGIVKQSAGHISSTANPDTAQPLRSISPAPTTRSARIQVGNRDRQPEAARRTILLVEDDDIMRSLTRRMLEEHGYTVFEADDGKSALEWVEAHPEHIDLLLTDVVMRRVSGPELVDRVGASRPI